MSRNGPVATGGRPPVRRHPADDQFTAPPTGQPASQWPPAPHYPDQPAHHGQQQGYSQQQAPGYYFPQAAEPDPNYGYAPQPAGQQPPFNTFPPPYPPPYQPAQMHQPQPQPHQQLAHAPQAGAPWSQSQADPRAFDLGNYMPAPAGQAYAPPAPQAYAQAEPTHYPPEAAHYQGDPARFGAPQQGYGETDAELDEAMAEDVEEPRYRRRGLMIAAALVGAIGLGGAMAYTYKTFVASSGARAPLIKNVAGGPDRIRPDTPGGKEFAHTDKKLLNRLPDERVAGSAEPQEDRASDDPNAPRRVKIIPITPGGQPPAAVVTSSVPPRPSGPPMVAVPGVTLENIGPPAAARAQMPSAARVAPQPPPPVRVASAAPTAVPAAAEPAPPPARKIVASPPKAPVPKVKEAAAAPVAAASPAGTSGFVAVLSSKKSRMDALKAFADLQQKYGDVLATRTPDVQEANLGDKGVWYRAVVGPPGSRDAAAGVCNQLKTAGHAGCWVTTY